MMVYTVFEMKFLFFSQALGTAINSTKVMTAQQVVKTEDGGEVKTAGLLGYEEELFTLNSFT